MERQLELFPRAVAPTSLNTQQRATVFVENCKWCGQNHQTKAQYIECKDEFLNR